MYCFFCRKFPRNTRRKCTCKKDLDRLPCFSKSPPEKLRLQCCSHNSPCRQWIFVRSYAQTCVRSMIAFPAFTLRKTAKDEKVFSTGAFSSAVSARHTCEQKKQGYTFHCFFHVQIETIFFGECEMESIFQALLVILHKIISVFVTGEGH